MTERDRKEFVNDLANLINRHSIESLSNTPDIILAEHLADCAEAWAKAIKLRNDWYYNPDRINPGVINPMEPNSHQP